MPGDQRRIASARQCAPGDFDRGMDFMFRDAITAHDKLRDRICQQLCELRLRPRTTEWFHSYGSLPGQHCASSGT
jgi:hypothetical protein